MKETKKPKKKLWILRRNYETQEGFRKENQKKNVTLVVPNTYGQYFIGCLFCALEIAADVNVFVTLIDVFFRLFTRHAKDIARALSTRAGRSFGLYQRVGTLW